MSSSVCQVCENESFKYRCADCRTRRYLSCLINHYFRAINTSCYSCSLACFKIHQDQCLSAEAGIDTSEHNAPSVDSASTTVQASANVQERTLNTEQVHALFRKHPLLKPKLNALYQSTLAQKSNLGSRDTGYRQNRNYTSKEDKAFSRALHDLKLQLQDEAAGEDVAAFAAYIRTLSIPDR